MKTRDRLRYQSEYKKQFDWKKPLEQEAPILSAEKMIYGVHGDEHLAKASKVKIPKKTEYQLQFVKHPIISSPEARKELLDKHLIGIGMKTLIDIFNVSYMTWLQQVRVKSGIFFFKVRKFYFQSGKKNRF